jgi:hypothetical protein
MAFLIVVFVFFFLVWLFSNQEIAGCQTIRIT